MPKSDPSIFPRQVAEADERTARITQAMNAGARAAFLRHKREGFGILIWRDGQVVEIRPEDIVIPSTGY